MTRFLLIAALCGMICWPPRADARNCGVQCHAEQVTAFVPVTYAVPFGIPVASPAAYSYSYSPPSPPVTVNVVLDSAALGSRIAAELRGPQPLRAESPPIRQPLALQAPAENPTPTPLPPQPDVPQGPSPGPPNPQPAPVSAGFAVFKDKCLRCHATANEALGRPQLAGVLNCEQRVAAIRSIVTDKMPKGGPPLNDNEAGDLIRYLSSK